MATLHMDVGTVSSTQQGLITAYEDLSGVLEKLSGMITQLRGGSWMGNSAGQFFQQYEDWQKDFQARTEVLNELATQLQQEITDWEEAASKLGH